ncbi:MAG: hypothetical protein R3F61_07875 [Myxococcota bacterium]
MRCRRCGTPLQPVMGAGTCFNSRCQHHGVRQTNEPVPVPAFWRPLAPVPPLRGVGAPTPADHG